MVRTLLWHHGATRPLVPVKRPTKYSTGVSCSLDGEYGLENVQKNEDIQGSFLPFCPSTLLRDNDGNTTVNSSTQRDPAVAEIDPFYQTGLWVLYFSLFIYSDNFYE